MKIRLTLTLLTIGCLLPACQKKDGADGRQAVTSDEPGETNDTAVPVNAAFQAALAEVNAKCPQSYPEIITPLPESKDFENIPTASLMEMLESWNPSLRLEASKALSERDEEVLATLKEGLNSDNWMVRAGSTSALATIIKKSLDGVKGDELEAVKARHSDIVAEFVRLAYDDRLEVRVSALEGLSIVAPQTPEAAKAVLNLCDDPDDYLSQDAMVILNKRFHVESLEQGEVVAAFKAALKRSLPNGKGHIVSIITRMKPEVQREFVPDLLALLDWKTMRDTMFAAGGHSDAIHLLTQMKEPGLIERLPDLMGKIQRGDGLFIPCLTAAKAFGRDAKVIVPELKAILADIEENGDKARIRPNRDIEGGVKELKTTIDYLESL